MDKRTKEYKAENKEPVIDRIYFSQDVYVTINGKRQAVRMLMANVTDLKFDDKGWLIVNSKGMTKINVASIATVIYK